MCDMEAGDYRIASAGMVQECVYEMLIESIWGCPGVHYEKEINISVGTYFIIIFALISFLYFIIGCIISAIKNKQYTDCQSNIPHITFWSKLPFLVCAGCIYSKDWFCQILCCTTKTSKDMVDYEDLDD